MSTHDDAIPAVEAPPRQVLDGLSVSISHCTACGRQLRARERLTVYAYRLMSDDAYTVARAYCRSDSCTRSALAGTLGATDVLATARLDDTRHGRRLVDVDVAAVSGPNDGSKP
jgi:hypothetical protein